MSYASLLQNLHHHPRPQKALDNWTEWLQTHRPDLCGHEHLVQSHLKSLANLLLDPLQFTYRANRFVDDALNMALHYTLQHLDSPGLLLSTLSSWLCYRTSSPSSTCLTPPADGSQTSCLTGSSAWSLGNMSLNPRPSAPDPPKDPFLLPHSSRCTPMVAPPVTCPSSSWSSHPGRDESIYRWEIDHLAPGAARTTWSLTLQRQSR